MFWNFNRYISLNISANFSRPLFCNKAAKTTNVYVLPFNKAYLNFLEHGFHGQDNIYFRYAGFVGNFVN